jgi:hypothetical protein
MTDTTSAAVWIDGDPLMEAIAAAVYEQCGSHPEQSLTVDDPRNIAAAAAAVARQFLGATEPEAGQDTATDAIDWKAKYEAEHARHVAVVRQLVADPLAVLRGAADEIDRETQRLKDDGVLEPDNFRPCRDATADLRRMADEAQQDLS